MRRALALALLLAAPPSQGQRVVEQVVAVIRTPGSQQPRVITLTRLEEETRIALVSRGATGAADGELDGPALRAGLEWLIDQLLLLEEVVRLQVFEVDRAEAVEELRRFQGRFSRPGAYRDFLARCDVTEEELLVVLRRMLRVQRYVDSRVAAAGRVREEEVDRLLGPDARSPDRAGLRGAGRAALAERRTGREVKALLADLRSRATIRVLEGFSGGEGRP